MARSVSPVPLASPFSLTANVGLTQRVICPEGLFAISGRLEEDSEVTAARVMHASYPAPAGSAWIVYDFCPQAISTAQRVGVDYFSHDSFQLVT